MKILKFSVVSLIYLSSLACLSSSNILSTSPDPINNIDQIQPTPKNNENKRIPFPDFNSPNALRHFIYDILRTVANGLVDGYNGEISYFRDYDCFS